LRSPCSSHGFGCFETGTKIQTFYGFTVSAAGEIFVNDGNGVGVFSPTANGDADPVR
jgi:hypothetical protein